MSNHETHYAIFKSPEETLDKTVFLKSLFELTGNLEDGQMICTATTFMCPNYANDLITQCDKMYSSTAMVETFYKNDRMEDSKMQKQLYYVLLGNVMLVIVSDSSYDHGEFMIMYTEE